VDGPRRVPGQPCANFSVFVRRMIINNFMDDLASGSVPFDAIEELDELLIPVAVHVLSHYGSTADVLRRVQGG
jgi:hypothetical protein